MDKLLKFLIYNMKTFDGSKGSAEGIIDALNKQDIEEYQNTRDENEECAKIYLEDGKKRECP